MNVYGGFGLVPGARNTWSYWIDHILKQRERFGFVAATMITTQGVVSAFTKDFLPTTAEVQVNYLVITSTVAQRVERWTCNQQDMGSNPTRGKNCIKN